MKKREVWCRNFVFESVMFIYFFSILEKSWILRFLNNWFQFPQFPLKKIMNFMCFEAKSGYSGYTFLRLSMVSLFISSLTNCTDIFIFFLICYKIGPALFKFLTAHFYIYSVLVDVKRTATEKRNLSYWWFIPS